MLQARARVAQTNAIVGAAPFGLHADAGVTHLEVQ
jgi:hypothetical protein